MNLTDATLIVLGEAAGCPELAALTQSAYDELAAGTEVPHAVLSAILGKYSGTAFDAIIMPICREVDRQKPVPPRRRSAPEDTFDPLTAPLDQLRQWH